MQKIKKINVTIIYSDTIMEVGFINHKKANFGVKQIVLRYLDPKEYKGNNFDLMNYPNKIMGKTDWFILPFAFASVVGKKLFEQNNAGMTGFMDNSINLLKEWLLEMDVIEDSMMY